jgi:hypothetical protein
MSGTSGLRQTRTATVATGTTTLAGLSAAAGAVHLATRISSGIRLVGAPIGCCDVRVLDRAEPNYLAPRRAVAASGFFEPPACHRPGVGAEAPVAPQPTYRGWLRGADRSGRGKPRRTAHRDARGDEQGAGG